MHLLIAFALLTSSGAQNAPFLLKKGDAAPTFTMRDLNGKMVSLSHHTGSSPQEPRKAVLMTFFATWCKPCKKEIPIIKDIHKRWNSHGVEVVYVGMSQSAKDLKPFAKAVKFPWRMVPDTFGLLSRRYGASRLPHLAIVDQQGRIAFQHRGIAENLGELIDSELVRITGIKAPPEVVQETASKKPRARKGKGRRRASRRLKAD